VMAFISLQITASISLGFCFLTFLMIALRFFATKRRISWIVVYVTLSDVFTSIGYLLGTPEDHSLQCSLQGYLTTTFPLCSFCWTAMAGWKLFQTCHQSNLTIEISLKTQFLLWFSCLAYGFLPLTTSRYGCATGTKRCWCYVTHLHHESDPTVWTSLWYYSFYLLLWISFFVYILLSVYVCSYLSSTDHKVKTSSSSLSHQIYKLGGYPLVIIICWLPISILEMLLWGKDVGRRVEEFCYVCLGLQGCFTSIVYYLTNASHWRCYHHKNAKISQSDLIPPPHLDPPKVDKLQQGSPESVAKIIYLTKVNQQPEAPLYLEDFKV
jgi:hypothetical protein